MQSIIDSRRQKCAAVIVAGGSGIRMNSAMPKQFLPLRGKPVLYHTIKAFLDFDPHIHIILVLPASQISYSNMILQHFPDRIDMTIIAGGHTRFHSVQNGVQAVEGEAIVFVHDGVRPFISKQLLQRCYDQALHSGSAIPCILVSDSIRQLTDSGSCSVNREALRAIQTPQTFQVVLLKRAFQQAYQPAFTDEATVAESAGIKIALIEGEKHNIKITTPEDLIYAECICGALQKMNK